VHYHLRPDAIRLVRNSKDLPVNVGCQGSGGILTGDRSCDDFTRFSTGDPNTGCSEDH
jgi:hypothetical protein